MSDAVKLRGHHLLCILPFIGRGYTPAFIENFKIIVARLNHGAVIEIVAGRDDICAALHGPQGPLCVSGEHCLQGRPQQQDAEALRDVGAMLGQEITIGAVIKPEEKDYQALRRAFSDGTIRTACKDCSWHEICTEIASGGFADALLMPPE